MNPILHLGMRLGVAGRKRVAVGGWLLVALPCLLASAVTGYLAAMTSSGDRPRASVEGVILSHKEDVRQEGNATHSALFTTYSYEVDGRTYLGVESVTIYHYQNEGSRKYDAERKAWLPEDAPAVRRAGDAVTVYYERAAPSRSSLSPPPGRGTREMLAIWSVASACSGILLTWLGWLQFREPVEILVASSARADAIVSAALDGEARDPGLQEEDGGISTDVARVRRREGTTCIEFQRESGPPFRLSGLYPPVLLLVILVWAVVLKDLRPSTARGLVAFAAIAAVLAYLAASLAYARARRELWVRNGVLEVVTRGLVGLSRRRLTRAQVDTIESRWALSEVSRFGETAFFDVIAVAANGKRVRIAEGLPRVEVADAVTRLVARELGLAPEQAVTARAATERDIVIARGAIARAPEA